MTDDQRPDEVLHPTEALRPAEALRHRPMAVGRQGGFDDVEVVPVEGIVGRRYASSDVVVAEVVSVLRSALPAVDPAQFGGYELVGERIAARLGYLEPGATAAVYEADDREEAVVRDQAERSYWLAQLREEREDARAVPTWAVYLTVVFFALLCVAVGILVGAAQ